MSRLNTLIRDKYGSERPTYGHCYFEVPSGECRNICVYLGRYHWSCSACPWIDPTNLNMWLKSIFGSDELKAKL